MMQRAFGLALVSVFVQFATNAQPSGAPASETSARLATLKAAAIAEVAERRALPQQIVDSLFSFSEIGYQDSRRSAI